MRLNPAFVSNIRDLYGQRGLDWINDLRSQLLRLSAKWDFRFLSMMPNLTYHFVGLVELSQRGESGVLKISPEINIACEALWLQSFDQGVPKVHWYDEKEFALLMERLEPGVPLKTVVRNGDDDAATRIIGQTIRNLQSHQHKQSGFKHLSELGGSYSSLSGHIDDKILSKGISLFRDLTCDRTQEVILHGDLHHDNILSCGSTWKVIDPHGYIGDPVFEIGPMIYNPGDCFPNDRPISQVVERRLKILAEELPFDPQRMKDWAFCMALLSIAWTFEDHGKIPDFEVKIASAIDQIQI